MYNPSERTPHGKISIHHLVISHHVAQGINIVWVCDCLNLDDPQRLGAGHTGLSPSVAWHTNYLEVGSKKVQYKDGGMSPSLSICHEFLGKFDSVTCLHCCQQVSEGVLENNGDIPGRSLRSMLETLAKFTDDNELSILLWCKSGTHRSVVMSQACGWALSQLDVEVIGRGPIITGGGIVPPD